MLTTLIASRPQDVRPISGTVVSVGVHAALIAMAVAATARVAHMPRDVHEDSHLVYFAPPATPAPPSTRTPTLPFQRRVDPAGPVIVAPMPTPVPGPAPVIGIPPVSASVGLPAPAGTAASDAPGATSTIGAASSASDSAPMSDYEVERAVQALQPVIPRYPEMLRAAGVGGSVRVRFVVDTSGRVEPASMEIVDATRDAFAAAVRSALVATRYQPAEAGGRRVRQLVEQVFTFRLQR